MPAYDETIIVQMADRLYSRAVSVLRAYSMFGAFMGIVAGMATTIPLDDETLMFVGLAFGGVLGALLGYALARERAFMLRLQAQSLMVQVQIERNTRSAAAARTA